MTSVKVGCKDRAKCRMRIGLQLVSGFGFNVRVSARFTFSVMVRCG